MLLSSKVKIDNCWLEQSPEKSIVSTVPFVVVVVLLLLLLLFFLWGGGGGPPGIQKHIKEYNSNAPCIA